MKPGFEADLAEKNSLLLKGSIDSSQLGLTASTIFCTFDFPGQMPSLWHSE